MCAAKTGAGNAGLPVAGKPAAFRLHLLRRPQPFRPVPSQRSAIDFRNQRLQAMAEWNAVTIGN